MNCCRYRLVLLLALLTGCSPPLKEAVSVLDQKSVCCESLATLPYAKLDVGNEIEVRIDYDSPAFAFEAGKSYFAAFTVPASTAPIQLTVRSFFSGDVFFPMVSILNGQHAVVRTIGTEGIRYYPPNWTDRGQIRGVIAIDPSSEKFAVIHTSSKVVGGAQYSRASGYAYATKTGAVFVPGGGSYVHQYSPVGWMKVVFEEIAAKPTSP